METEKTKNKKVVTRKAAIKIKLSEPIEFGEEVIAEITLQPPKGKHLKALPANPALKDILVIASKISGVPMAVIDEMSADDVMRIAEAVGELL